MAARFCQEHDVPQEALVGLVRGCRALFRPAALADVAVATVTIDLNQLCGEHPGIVKRLSEWYGQALPRVRVEAMLGSLDDFGAVLDDVRVRKQYLPTSKHAPSVLTPLSTMTLFYREAGEEKRVTLQLTPDTLALLRARCDTLTE